MSTRPLWTVVLFFAAACLSVNAAGHPPGSRSLTSNDIPFSPTPEDEHVQVTALGSNVQIKTLDQTDIDLRVLQEPATAVATMPLRSPTNPPNPMTDLEIPDDSPGVVMGKAGAGKPAPFSVNQVFQSSSQNNQGGSWPSGANDLAYGESGFPYTTQSALAQDGFSPPDSPSPTNKYPWVAAGPIYVNWTTAKDSKRTGCTASLIAPGLLVTAAHCVVEFGNDTVANGLIQFIPGRFDRYAPFGVASVKRTIYPKVYANGSDECKPGSRGIACANDLAVLILNPDSEGNYIGYSTGWMSYGWNGYSFSRSFKENTSTAEITQLGYPGLFDSGTRMIRTDAPAITQAYNQQVMGSAQTQGFSGGPWVVNFGAFYSAQLTNFGIDYAPNVIVGVSSWLYNDQSLKATGASRFGTNKAFPNEANIVTLVKAACSSLSSQESALVCNTRIPVPPPPTRTPPTPIPPPPTRTPPTPIPPPPIRTPPTPIPPPPTRTPPPPNTVVESCLNAQFGSLCDCTVDGNECVIFSDEQCYQKYGGSIYGPVGICVDNGQGGACTFCDATGQLGPSYNCPSGYRCRGQTGYQGDCTDSSFPYGTCVPV